MGLLAFIERCLRHDLNWKIQKDVETGCSITVSRTLVVIGPYMDTFDFTVSDWQLGDVIAKAQKQLDTILGDV